MKVKILSGQNAGQHTDLEGAELEFNLSTGFVEPVDEGEPAPAPRVHDQAQPAAVVDETPAGDPPVDDIASAQGE